MPLQQLRNCNMGRNRANATGSSGVGYTIYNIDGSVQQLRTTAGVYQIAPDTGIYAAFITFPDEFRGQVLWDTGTAFLTSSYATEEYNVEQNDPRVASTWQMVSSITGSIKLLRDMTEGRWQIVANQMVFYAADNLTEVARFDLYDDTMTPSMDAVFQRIRVP